MQPADNTARPLPVVQPADLPFIANDGGGVVPRTPAMPPPVPGQDRIQLLQGDTKFTPPHTHTESTLAPTSEFMRYVLAALPSRYVLRGLYGLIFNDPAKRGTGLRKILLDFFGKFGDRLHHKYGVDRDRAEDGFYAASLGIGSLGLTLMYSRTVYADMKNIFSETVGAEFGKPPEAVDYSDLAHSQNRIVKRTLDNFWARLGRRLMIDILFFPAAFIRHERAGDLVLGLKGVQLFTETWKRKTTMFEDFITFVNNKINPRNGLGQPIVVGEVFDLYQHYAQEFNPAMSFKNVIEHGGNEGILWAKSEPIFRRITELMNQTYAYKHPSRIDPTSGQALQQANFALPIFIHLLGNDLIDLRAPERTQLYIEVANSRGIAGVKQMQQLVAAHMPLPVIAQQLGVHIPPANPQREDDAQRKNENGVIIKGSSMQLDAAHGMHRITHPAAAANTHFPTHRIATADAVHTAPQMVRRVG